MVWEPTNAEAVVPCCKIAKMTVQNNATLHHFLSQCKSVLYEVEAAAEAYQLQHTWLCCCKLALS